MSKKNKQENEKEYGIVSWVGLVLSIISVVIAVWTISASNTNAKTDRRVDTYTEDLLKVGKYDNKFNEILGIEIAEVEIYRSKGLPAHMLKSKHQNCLKYIDYIPDIIENPDYVGVNPNEKENNSFELIKRYKDNILIGIKLDKDGDYLYVVTMHEVQESKIIRRLHSGRIKEVITECKKLALKT